MHGQAQRTQQSCGQRTCGVASAQARRAAFRNASACMQIRIACCGRARTQLLKPQYFSVVIVVVTTVDDMWRELEGGVG